MRLLMDIPQAAEILGGISKETVRRLIASGELPIVRLRGRVLIEEAALVELVQRNKTQRANHEAVCVGAGSEATDGLSAEG
jgi:excisionase family DNA binding protein